MNLHDEFQNELSRKPGATPCHLAVGPQGNRLECELVDADSLACKFTRLTYQTDALRGASMDRLAKVSRTLTARLQYLLEPIGPIESDQESCTIQLRSLPPQKDPDGTRYYELIVRRGGQLSLRRYHKIDQNPREVIPATVTNEVLLRLVGDLLGAVDVR
jgi:hypothetical protein